MATPREHIEEIRRKKFNIGGEPDPKNEDLHHAVNYLSAELYSKDNAEDNEYFEGVQPSLEFVITSRDITCTGASATLLVFNNEKGFSSKNIESICSVGRSTKKGFRKHGYIGEKGIGFKSVFLITAQPYIFSNGYQIRFNEEPCSQCKVGYIVPEWVDDNPTLSTIKQIHGADTSLPTTTIVLPLKPDKVKPVKQQLSTVHPEVLLFLLKIKRLSVKEDNEDPRLNSVTAISISSEKYFVKRKNIDAESYLLNLSADEHGDNSESECSYHMWRQRFPVSQENKVERRMEVEEWVLTLAFPNGQRLNRGMNLPGVYAFLPTEMATNFPFIIQADFLLASSREKILMDNKWNQGILGCVPSAFINAFISLVKTLEDAPVSSLPPMFEFLPINSSPCPELNAVRENIKEKLMKENIVPCESHMEQKFFQKPGEVGRLMPAFWNILIKAKNQGVNLHNISSHGIYVLSSSFDRRKYDPILNFLGVKLVEDEWYAKCIRGTNLVLGVSEEVYLELLLFLAKKWQSNFQKTSIKNVPLLKYTRIHGDVSLYSVHEVLQRNGVKVFVSCEHRHISWLIDWNREFRCIADQFFVPNLTQEALQLCSNRQTILEWLLHKVGVEAVNVYQYAALLVGLLHNDKKLAIAYVHFLYHSLSRTFLSEREVNHLCGSMPLVDNYGRVSTRRSGVLVPAYGSKWVSLIGSNPWRDEGFVELGEDYLYSGKFASISTPEKQLTHFLKSHLLASDVPDISPPNAVIPTMSAPLTKQNTFFLLDWIRCLKRKGVRMPERFCKCIKEGRWMKISLSGSPDYRSPSESFLPDSSWGNLLQHDSVLVDIPIIDQGFYGHKIHDYKEELKSLGVMFEYGEACQFIGKHLMYLAAALTLTKGNVLSILKFIKFLREKYLSPEDFIRSIREGRWLRTSIGDRSPVGSVLFDQEWKVAAQISNIPFIDQDYYGEEILYFKTELQMLGVVIGFGQSYQLVADYLKSPAHISALTAESGLFVLECLCHLRSSDEFVRAFRDKKFLKTNLGYMSPVESHLFNPEWGCLLQVFNSFPLIDQNFYGSSILWYKNELKQLGVVVDLEEATKAFARIFKQQATLSSISKDSVLLFLACYRKLQGTTFKFPEDLESCIRDVKWLRTRLSDYRVPRECILFGPDWESISSISLLPFIDDSDNYYGKGIYEYEKELKRIGVVIAFKAGYRLVSDRLYLPQDPGSITTASVYSLLEHIRNLQQQNEPLPESFLKKIAKKWLKTHAGYKSPDKCLLFDSNWNSFLHQEDGPFIDEEFYGSKITSYSKELDSIGVTVEVRNGCPLLASFLDFHSKFITIVRIYNYLCEFKWEPDGGDTRKIWIPNGSDDGEWVIPEECVLYDKNDLFGMQLNVLAIHYDQKLLIFFFNALGVRRTPSVDDYCQLWKEWENTGQPLSSAACCAFWEYIIKNWSLKTEKTMAEHLLKLPVCSSGSDGISMFDRHDVFIADDLQLKDLFENSFSRPLFVWYPQPSLPSLPRGKLFEIYSKIGVRTISESMQKEEVSITDGVKNVIPRKNLIGKGLVRLILGFLADLSLEMEAEKRHEAVRCLLDLTVLETLEPITIGYSLSLSSGEILKEEARRMFRWERESKKIFYTEDGPVSWTQKCRFLMKSKNLQLFSEDEKFLSSAFPSD
ncbi:ATP/DNA binding protein [Actinidia rufa]|uniref:ATP/DNA binding protein n=1 Tax=Actinidia rufa TaxID=165716 RepID=A0A7J0FYZ8_9ERIC|nr:ATP/DNA binding protein [Actinidia rufa]